VDRRRRTVTAAQTQMPRMTASTMTADNDETVKAYAGKLCCECAGIGRWLVVHLWNSLSFELAMRSSRPE